MVLVSLFSVIFFANGPYCHCNVHFRYLQKNIHKENTILKRFSLFFRERKHREEAAEREKAERLERERVEKERKEQERIKRERVGERGHILKETAQAQAAVDQHFTESLRLASQKVRIV